MIEELDTSKYEEDIQAIEKKVANLGHIPDLVAFYGSSSIRLWETLKSDMSPLEVINLGFGGSSYPYCHMYFYRIFKNLKPSKIVLYAGDNDLGTGHEPTRILRNFNLLLNDIVRKFRNANIYTISIKPSPRREGLMPKTVATNDLIKKATLDVSGHWIDVYSQMLSPEGKPRPELYVEDMLHLNEKGYEIWKRVVREHLL